MKFSTIALGAFAALALAAPADVQSQEVQAIEARALAQDVEAVNELVARQIWQCFSCVGGWRLCCGNVCSRNRC